MSGHPNDLKYLDSHEWARIDEDGAVITVGITDYAQDKLGDVVYVDSPAINLKVTAGTSSDKPTTVAVIESVKAASDIFSPVSGTVIAINTSLENEPELVNQSPYDDGWLFKIKPNSSKQLRDELEAALDTKAYTAQITEAQ
jgi:glycine cleavage system H protein